MQFKNILETGKRELLSIGQAAEYLGVSIDTIRRWEKKGRIEALRSPGGHRYFDKKDLDSLFGKKYVRDEPTIRSKKEELTISPISPITPSAKRQAPLITPIHDILDRPVRNIEIPPPAPIRIILEERQAFIQETSIAQNSVLTPPQTSFDSIVISSKPTEQEYQSKQKGIKIDKIWIIVGGIVILLIVFFVIFLWQSSQKVLSPIP